MFTGLLGTQWGASQGGGDALSHWEASHQPFHWFSEFYGVLASGGFDAIVGNPPYVETNHCGLDYSPAGFASFRSGNLFALTMERSAKVVGRHGFFGLIVPISAISAARFEPLRAALGLESRRAWLASFSNRPSQLFSGAQNRLTVAVSRFVLESPAVWTTKYHRWDGKTGERETLFELMRFEQTPVDDLSSDRGIPKLGSPSAVEVFKRVSEHQPISRLLQRTGGKVIYWVRVPGYFCQFFLSPPNTRDERTGRTQVRGELLSISVESDRLLRLLHAALNSGLFGFYYTATTDGRHINPSDVRGFPLSPPAEEDPASLTLCDLSRGLEETLNASKSVWRKSGLLIDTYDSGAAKRVLDAIDQALSPHYRLNDEQLDFIINYDIKYRMGLDAGQEDEE